MEEHMPKFAIGIEIGGTSTTVGVVTETGELIGSNASNPISTCSEKYKDINVYMDDLASEILRLKELHIDSQNGIAMGIGIGAPNGNRRTNCIEKASNLHTEWQCKHINIAEMLEIRVMLPVYLDNDANAAAIGEFKYRNQRLDRKSPERNMSNFIAITLGSGLGSGIYTGGKLLYGGHGLAGELGHIVIQKSFGRRCGCGRAGCLETYASAKGVARTAMEFLEVYKDKKSKLYSIYKERKEKGLNQIRQEHKENGNECYRDMLITSKDVYEAAVEGDAIALEIFEYTGKILGKAIADFAAFTDPDAIYLCGGLANAGDYILLPTRKYFNENLISVLKDKGIVIDLSALNEDSCGAVLGASALVWDRLNR